MMRIARCLAFHVVLFCLSLGSQAQQRDHPAVIDRGAVLSRAAAVVPIRASSDIVPARFGNLSGA
jgi:hypothetical protein